MTLTPEQFVQRYASTKLKESALAQSHFKDLCDLLGVPSPVEGDRPDRRYQFEQPVSKVSGGSGFADVWLQGHFGWEYKGPGADLKKAYTQLLAYREDLGNPPLLIVSDAKRIEIHTNFTGTQKVVEAFALDDLLDDHKRLRLREAWVNPAAFNPTPEREKATEQVVKQLLLVSDALKDRGEPPEAVAHFLVKVVFTLFAQAVQLLPRRPFSLILEAANDQPEDFQELCSQLFTLMGSGGKSWLGRIPHINGGVFTDPVAPALGKIEIGHLQTAAGRDWAHLEPSIFGTLFERVIDRSKRSQLGAHYTPLQDILDVVLPVVIAPLRAEWEALRAEQAPLIAEAQRQQQAALSQDLFNAGPNLWETSIRQAKARLQAFQQRLAQVRVLDPAMGSGNFLFVTLRLLLDLEAEVRATLRQLSALVGESATYPPLVGPEQMRGLELSTYAHEIASMVLWIGYLQWLAEHGEPFTRSPVLSALPGLENRDAVLNGGDPAAWPDAEFIVGNPPFVGNYKMREELGGEYTEALRAAYEGRVPGFADLVAYWFEQARAQIEQGHSRRAGLIATNSIKGGKNRVVLERIAQTGGIFRAWPDRVWVQDGAAVRTSVVCFDDGSEPERVLLRHTGNESDPTTRQTETQRVSVINPDLTSAADLTGARRLKENTGKSFTGMMPAGKFDLPGSLAREWLDLPNPSGVSNADVLKPYVGGDDITDKNKDRWTVDFNQMPLEEAQKYRRPMQHVMENVKPERDKNNEKATRENWWRYKRTVPPLRAAFEKLTQFIGTSEVSKHRTFVKLPTSALPSRTISVIAADDDLTFGVLNSSLHMLWALRMGTFMGKGNDSRYTPTTCFETFPFPRSTAEQAEAVSQAARYLDQTRAYLKSKRDPSKKADAGSSDQDKTLTLTGMYNLLTEYRSTGKMTLEAITTLADAHDTLDQAVAAAYGWEWPLSEDEVLSRLLALNLERAAEQAS